MTHAVRPKAETDEPYATVSPGRGPARRARARGGPSGRVAAPRAPSGGNWNVRLMRCVEALDLQAQLLYHFPF